MLYRNCSENCILKKFLEAKNPCFVTKNCSKYFYICVFILSRKQYNCLQKDFHNSRMVGRRKLSDPSFNRAFKTLSIGGKYTLLFQQIKFGLKCLIKTKKISVRCHSQKIFVWKISCKLLLKYLWQSLFLVKSHTFRVFFWASLDGCVLYFENYYLNSILY